MFVKDDLLLNFKGNLLMAGSLGIGGVFVVFMPSLQLACGYKQAFSYFYTLSAAGLWA